MIFGFGFGVGVGNSDEYSFEDSDALAYYNAIKDSNGGDIDANSIFNISLRNYQFAIDRFFIELKGYGVYNKLIQGHIFFGGGEYVHIDMITLAPSNIEGSPLINKNGCFLDGVNDYVTLAFTTDGYPSNTNHGFSVDIVDLDGVINGRHFYYANNTFFMNENSGNKSVRTFSSNSITADGGTGFFTHQGNATTRYSYKDGVEFFSNAYTPTSLDSEPIILGWNYLNFQKYGLGCCFVHEYLDETETSALNDALLDFKIRLGI